MKRGGAIAEPCALLQAMISVTSHTGRSNVRNLRQNGWRRLLIILRLIKKGDRDGRVACAGRRSGRERPEGNKVDAGHAGTETGVPELERSGASRSDARAGVADY